MFNSFNLFPSNQAVLTPSDTDDIPQDNHMLIECGSDGTIRVTDTHGNTVDRTVTAGYIIPVLVARVHATGTTVDPVIGLW